MTDSNILARRRRVLGASLLFYDEPLTFVRGEGVYLYSDDGRRYLDCYNNVPCVGHCNPRVVEAIARQASVLNVHSRYVSDVVVEYAERLLATFETKFDQVMFTCSGSEANDQALRIARTLARGRGIICTNFAYHGNTAAVAEVSPLFHHARQHFTEVRTISFPDSYRPLRGLSGNALVQAYTDELQSAIDSFDETGIGVAGLIFCSVFANEGLPDVPPGLLAAASKLVRKAGGFVISDEVQAGFGRTGRMWGHELMGFTPDIVTMGKPMGNGFPVAALVSRADILDAYRAKVTYFNTFAGAQVAAAAAGAVLDEIIERGLVANSQRVGDHIRTGFSHLAERHNIIGDIRGTGLWIGVELVRDRRTKTPAPEETARLVNLLKSAGCLVGRIGEYDNVLKIRPPLVCGLDHADELLSAAASSLERL